jgi:hypothetical protein
MSTAYYIMVEGTLVVAFAYAWISIFAGRK